MDLLFQRYADPMTLLSLMIRSGRFFEFVCEIVNIKNEETEEQTLWEIWLHKDFEQSFVEFHASLEQSSTEEMEEEELAAIVRQSQEILSLQKEGEDHWL